MYEVIKAVAYHLENKFSPTKIFTEEVPQKAPDTYFFITFISGALTKLTGGRYQRTISVDISFDTKLNKDLIQTGDVLIDHFRYVPFGDYPIRPTNFSQTITDGILHTILDFDIHLFENTELWDKMRTLYFEGGVQNG